MKLITLTSDWTLQEPYLAMLKGRLFSHLPDAYVLDHTHAIEIGNVNQTAFLLRHSYSSFPESTVHLVLTGASSFLLSKPVVVAADGHFFVGEDNGVFSLLTYGMTGLVVRQYDGEEGDFFDKMIQLAGWCLDGNWQEHTTECMLQMRIPFTATYVESQNMIAGHIAYIDAYSNVVTNIPVSLFEEKVHDGRFTARIETMDITHYHRTYVADTEPYLIPNSLGVMEIAAYRGRLSILAKWQKDTSVDIYCYRLNN